MLNTIVLFLATSYVAWYMEQFELLAVYPFDDTYATPEAAGVPHLKETQFQATDGTELIVWRADAAAGQPTILYFSGNAGALRDRADRFERLTERGYGVIAPAYRGSSGSDGEPEENLLLADARAVARAVEGPLVLYGESLGAAVAIRLAADGVGDALVLEAPFTSLPDLVSAQYPAEDLDHLITQRWNSLAAVGGVRQPLLVIHGENDRVVPVAMGQEIFHAAGSARKKFLRVSAQGHQGLWTVEVQTALYRFFERSPH